MLHVPELHRPALRPAPADADISPPRLVPPFDHLDADETRRLLCNAAQVSVDAPSLIFRRGEPAAELHLLLGGVVRLLGPDDAVLGVIEGSGALDLADLFTGRHTVSALAERRSRLLRLPAAAVAELFARRPDLVVPLARELGRNHAAAIETVIELRCYSPIERLAAYLLKTLPAAPRPPIVGLSVKKGVLASRLGMTAACFARSLTRLADAGAVRRRRKGIEVVDPAALRRFVDAAAGEARFNSASAALRA